MANLEQDRRFIGDGRIDPETEVDQLAVGQFGSLLEYIVGQMEDSGEPGGQVFDLTQPKTPTPIRMLGNEAARRLDQPVNTAITSTITGSSEIVGDGFIAPEEQETFAGRVALFVISGRVYRPKPSEEGAIKPVDCSSCMAAYLDLQLLSDVKIQTGESEGGLVFFGEDITKN